MGRYADYEGYRLMYPDGLSEAEFGGVLARAEALADVWTAGRAQQAQGWALEQLRMAIYALANEMHEREKNGGGALIAVRNDGYSEEYAKEKDGEEKLRAEAMKWLSGTGLVSAL